MGKRGNRWHPDLGAHLPPQPKPVQWVYFIATSCYRYVKIGTSEKPYKRLKDLQACHPELLDIVDMMEGEIALERELHRKFKRFKVHGEWFRFEKPIHVYIDKHCGDLWP